MNPYVLYFSGAIMMVISFIPEKNDDSMFSGGLVLWFMAAAVLSERKKP